jgi:nucleoside-diphosphate-sugar epimerase
MSTRGTVLVTGGSGFIAGWCIKQLIEEGWQVRATLRALKREAEVRGWLSKKVDLADRLTFVQADLIADAGWAQAMAGVEYVLHVASPIPATLPRHEDELIVPAREGTLRALRFARDAGARRVVVTSSTAAITYGFTGDGAGRVFTEADWTDETHPDASPYIRSKAIAEKAAWDFMKREGGAMTMATVNPAAVLGPVMGPDFSPSLEIVKKLLEGAFPGSPPLGFPLVDVRDIADLHLRAMTHPSAAGERFLGGQGFVWMQEVAQVLRLRLGAQARKVPAGGLPGWMVRLLATFDPVTRSVVFELGKRRAVTPEKAIRMLGWAPRSNEDAIVAAAESLLAEGIVRP